MSDHDPTRAFPFTPGGEPDDLAARMPGAAVLRDVLGYQPNRQATIKELMEEAIAGQLLPALAGLFRNCEVEVVAVDGRYLVRLVG